MVHLKIMTLSLRNMTQNGYLLYNSCSILLKMGTNVNNEKLRPLHGLHIYEFTAANCNYIHKQVFFKDHAIFEAGLNVLKKNLCSVISVVPYVQKFDYSPNSIICSPIKFN